MNIFELIGLRPDHRKESKITQLVKHWDDVIEKNKEDKTFAVQRKKDGVCSIVVVGATTAGIYSRTGRKFTNTEILEGKILELKLPKGVYMGEMCHEAEDVSLEVLSGAVNPNRKKALDHEDALIPLYLEMFFFDYLTIPEFRNGKSNTTFHDRHAVLSNIVKCCEHIHVIAYEIANNENEIDTILNRELKARQEGIVIRDIDAHWEAGHKGWRVMKKVKGVDYDLRCIGYEEGKGKYKGKVANLVFDWKDGKTIKCMLGKGWTHNSAAGMFKEAVAKTPNTPIGKIFQVYALDESSKGKLRLPKVGELRHDKDVSDV